MIRRHPALVLIAVFAGAMSASVVSGAVGADSAPAPIGAAPDLRCPSALCRSDEATRQLSAGYRACMTGAGASLAARRGCVRQEQALQNSALGLIHRMQDARTLGTGDGGYDFDNRRLFYAARLKVCDAISREWAGEAARLAFETCELHKTAERVVRQRRSMLP